MAELETAEAFARVLVTHLADTLIAPTMSPAQAKAKAIALIEADRKAVALRAKRELLDELEHAAAEWHAVQAPCEWKSAFNVMCDKYQEKP